MKTAIGHSASQRMLRFRFPSLAAGLLLLVNLSAASDRELSVGELTTISSMVHKGYEREKLPDGSFKTIRYAFGEGTFDPGGTADPSAERLKFSQLAVLLSEPLAKLGYQPSNDVKKIDQLIVVHWGRTIGFDGGSHGDVSSNLNLTYGAMKAASPTMIPQMAGEPVRPVGGGGMPAPNTGSSSDAPKSLEEGTPGAEGHMESMALMIRLQDEARNRANARNALLLGYYDTLRHTPTAFGNLVAPRRERLMSDLEDDRYYVAVIAYDFQATRKSRQPKILWITRFSLQTRGNEFDRSINRMVYAAAPYFGRSSEGLKRERLPEGKAVPGDLKFLEYLENKK